MFAKFLFFSGGWESEGNFFALETEKDVVILACGKSAYQTSFNEFQKIGFDFIKTNASKIRGIIASNINFQNIGSFNYLIELLRNENVFPPIYATYNTKLFFSYNSSSFSNNIIEIDEKKDGYKIGGGDFSINFLLMGSNLLGNFAFCINFLGKYTFYFFESFSFSSVLENDIIFPELNLNKLQEFLTPKNEKVYLMLSTQGMHWQNKNSLFLYLMISHLLKVVQNFLFFYDFDWLRILELLEIVKRKQKKIVIIDEGFFGFISKVLENKKEFLEILLPLSESKNNKVDFFLLTASSLNIKSEIKKFLEKEKIEEREKINFIVGMPPFIGGEENLAKVIDYLYSHSDFITNLSKTEYFSTGTSFYDLKYLLKILKPDFFITYQNSYKNSKYFGYLNLNLTFINIYNGKYIDLPEQKIYSLERKKNLISIDEVLEKQRDNLKKNGLLMIVLVTKWESKEFKLSRITIENFAVSFDLDISKLKERIKRWWKTKLILGIKEEEQDKISEKIIKKRLNLLLLDHFKNKIDIEVEEFLILMF